jgi:hypothetical protein
MEFKLFLIRKIKALYLRFKLHKIFGIFNSFFYNLYYLNKFSEWASKNRDFKFNDFYSKSFVSNKRFELYQQIYDNELKNDDNINYLEFGVAYGNTFRWWTTNVKSVDAKFYGFDTFEGLPEDWHLFKKGDMSPDGKFPEIQGTRHTFVKGLFQNTLIDFLKRFNDDKRKVIHIDADLYTSTLFVLTTLAPLLRKDDIIIFDEFGVPTHEFKAFTEFVTSFYVKYQLITSVNNYFQLAIKIVETPFENKKRG